VIFIDDQILDGYALYVGKDVEPDRLLYYKALCPQISCVGWAQGGAATCPLWPRLRIRTPDDAFLRGLLAGDSPTGRRRDFVGRGGPPIDDLGQGPPGEDYRPRPVAARQALPARPRPSLSLPQLVRLRIRSAPDSTQMGKRSSPGLADQVTTGRAGGSSNLWRTAISLHDGRAPAPARGYRHTVIDFRRHPDEGIQKGHSDAHVPCRRIGGTFAQRRSIAGAAGRGADLGLAARTRSRNTRRGRAPGPQPA
jgi:hypothetical protein